MPVCSDCHWRLSKSAHWLVARPIINVVTQTLSNTFSQWRGASAHPALESHMCGVTSKESEKFNMFANNSCDM